MGSAAAHHQRFYIPTPVNYRIALDTEALTMTKLIARILLDGNLLQKVQEYEFALSPELHTPSLNFVKWFLQME